MQSCRLDSADESRRITNCHEAKERVSPLLPPTWAALCRGTVARTREAGFIACWIGSPRSAIGFAVLRRVRSVGYMGTPMHREAYE